MKYQSDINNILIIGAGIAGLTAAYWLNHYGFSVEIIERAPTPARGRGYLLDFWGAGFSVAEKMGIIEKLAKKSDLFDKFIFLDSAGNTESFFHIAQAQKLHQHRIFTLFRSEFENTLYSAVKDFLPIRYGVTAENLVEQENHVIAYFSDQTKKTFDLVIGADGTHSLTRTYVSQAPLYYLGYQLVAAIQKAPIQLDHSLYTYCLPERQVSVCPISRDEWVVFYTYRSAQPKKALKDPYIVAKEAFRGARWVVPELLDALENAKELFFDDLAQVRLENWHRGRIVLIGDACQCLTLAAGQGASMAMAGAYILADRLHRSKENYQAALTQYESIMKPGMVQKQKTTEAFLKLYMPGETEGLNQRNFYTRHFFKAIYEKTAIERFFGSLESRNGSEGALT
ncbi:MAG: hypothetical protein A3F12_08145 [Gammaproteobacteria bacterium RIFCSPHIGHO2_12_FULL_38_14]|nr:MAG: hypothetical protein A3F12_08145 [Gammaproteobacteria bacterium RIFCSPHIGHO2_12_FULL_38_14]